MKKYKVTFFFICLFLFQNIHTQTETSLPKGLTKEEKNILSRVTFRNSILQTPAPTSPVRTMAEWEEIEYLVLRWDTNYQNILRQIVAVGVQECKVIIATQNQTSVSNYLTSNGINLANVIFLNAPSNSIWIRDYAGNTVYENEVGNRALVDWIYNRPRPFDDIMPSAHATLLNIPIYITNTSTNDLVNTGGNFMSDGQGNAFASELILEENQVGNPYNVTPKTESQIDGIMQNYMGINNYIKMPVLPFDEIHHIDMHMKLLDEETLLVSRYPTGIADGPQIISNINYVLNNHLSTFGTPYKIKWIDAPPSTSGSYPDTGGLYRTFTNSVFINKSVIVPVYRPQVDAAAISLYQQLLPGYNIVGIDVDNSNENLIASLGAIHCITHTIGVQNPLLIVHQPIAQANVGDNVMINATVKHQSGIAEAKLFWRVFGENTFNESVMNNTINANYTTSIAVPANASKIEYYIEGEANSGKKQTRPLVAPQGFWTMEVQNLSQQDFVNNQFIGPFPNPIVNKASFKTSQLDEEVALTITNALGQKLSSTSFTLDADTFSLELAPEWQGVLYFIFEGSFGRVVKTGVKM